MEGLLLELLRYRGVLSIVATTSDGLVIATAGLDGADGEAVAAAGSSLATQLGEQRVEQGEIATPPGTLHLVMGEDLMLAALCEAGVPGEPLRGAMGETLVRLTAAIQHGGRPA